LSDILQEARTRNYSCFKSRTDPRSSSLRLHFGDFMGGRYVASTSFTRALRHAGKFPDDVETLLPLQNAIDSLVLNTPGFEAMRRIRTRRGE
jgi:hypothetical protein